MDIGRPERRGVSLEVEEKEEEEEKEVEEGVQDEDDDDKIVRSTSRSEMTESVSLLSKSESRLVKRLSRSNVLHRFKASSTN